MASTVPVLVTYRPKKGREARFLEVLLRHWPALQRSGLVARARHRLWRATDKRSGRDHFVEAFSWRSEEASDAAHRSPEVQAVWGPMMPLLESMDIAVVRPVVPGRRRARAEAPRRPTRRG